ncbi:cuticle protein 16.5-like [Leptidea sinapis]|uniref:cuticle protein 16.5-like n=1 Tax=Leptidea sinapis TaxID=189913 RepID=UPI0021C2786B|nr:cuticle protein 16.5-like [Leptidea sinapis]
MQSLVVFLALASVACGSYLPLAQPPHHPAVVLDPHGRPLDTAEVINARAVHYQAKALEPRAALGYGHAALALAPVAPLALSYAAPAAVSHQSRVDVRTSPAVVSHAVAAPVLAHSVLAPAPALSHYLHKRSLGHYAVAAPVLAVAAPAAVSHQSRVDVRTSPAVVSHAVATPVLAHSVLAAPAAISHQSRVDVRTSPALVAPVVAHYAAPAPLHYAAPAPLHYAAPAPIHLAGHYAHAW